MTVTPSESRVGGNSVSRRVRRATLILILILNLKSESLSTVPQISHGQVVTVVYL